jgi:uncharacterized protein (DUF952 family)
MKKIYHITTMQNWKLAQEKGQYDFCTLKTDGFIHFSTVEQFLKTANRIFAGKKDLVLLEVSEDSVINNLVYENLEGGTEQFPHLYCPLKSTLVLNTYELKIDNEGKFTSPF